MEHFELTPETAHPKAKALMKDEFYWSHLEETAPFGNDDGSDAFYGFREWRLTNPTTSPTIYLKELIKSWQYPQFDLNEMDTTKISKYLTTKFTYDQAETEKDMSTVINFFKSHPDSGGRQIDEIEQREIMARALDDMGITYLISQDNAVIAIGFGQFVLEGKIDEDIKALTKTAIDRELLPILIDRWDGVYNQTRKEQLTKMLEVVDLMNK